MKRFPYSYARQILASSETLSALFIRIGKHNRFSSSSPAFDGNKQCQIIDISDLAIEMRQSVRDYVQGQSNQTVNLVGIMADNNNEDSELYSNFISECCEEDGINYEICRVIPSEPKNIQEAIKDANRSPSVHGILVYYPIFRTWGERGPYKNQSTGVYYKSYDDLLRDLVLPGKDVEGLCTHYNEQWLFQSSKKFTCRGSNNKASILYPCTALAVFKIVQKFHHQMNKWNGVTITIINRSEIFGRPLAVMLANEGAVVYSIDKDNILQFRPGGRLGRVGTTLEKCLEASSVVISGVPSPNYSLPCEFLQPGTLVVNVSEYENISEKSILEIPSTKFVPKIGKVTIAALEQNLIQLHAKRFYKE